MSQKTNFLLIGGFSDKLDIGSNLIISTEDVPIVVETAASAIIIPSTHESEGLSIQIEDPIIKADRTSYERLSEQLDSYSHIIKAIGGYWSARFKVNNNQINLEDWIEKGLGRHIVVSDPSLDVVWEGFVNKMTIVLGALTYTQGPLMEIGNRVSVVYSTVDTTGGGRPVVGIRTVTDVINDTDSQTKYGIIEKVISIGGATPLVAEQVRDTWLKENANPKTSRKSNLSQVRVSAISVGCLGYWHWGKTYIYTSLTKGLQPINEKIESIIDAQPNTIFSTDFTKINTNPLSVSVFDDSNRKAESVLKELNSIGDSQDRRYTIGVYQDRQFHYSLAPTRIAYNQRIAGNEGITDTLDRRIKPYNVLPGRWIFYPDFLPGQTLPVTADLLQTDKRAGFIESVKFKMPGQVSIDGGKLEELNQLMAKVGIQGVGA